jgi:hypothetical protein
VFFLTYLKQKHPLNYTSLESSFLSAFKKRRHDCMPHRNSLFCASRVVEKGERSWGGAELVSALAGVVGEVEQINGLLREGRPDR